MARVGMRLYLIRQGQWLSPDHPAVCKFPDEFTQIEYADGVRRVRLG